MYGFWVLGFGVWDLGVWDLGVWSCHVMPMNQLPLPLEKYKLFLYFFLYFLHIDRFQFLDGNRLSRILLAPQLAAPPMTPPTTALPTNTAPAMTIGASLGLGKEEKDGGSV
jgi:hypothetical protein